MPNIVQHLETNELKPIIEVNCANKSLKALPTIIPKYTRILRLERNEITDLKELLENPLYRRVEDLYLDFNLIGNIDNLEGSHFLSHFRVLSLIGNGLTQV